MSLENLARLGAQAGEPLARHTSLKVGGPADLFLIANSAEQAVAALQAAIEACVPVLFIGGGSNLLPADEGVQGLVIKYAGARYQLVPEGNRAVLVAESGCSLAGLARRVSREGWSGLEWAVNVPGTVGGAAVNNAGAFGSCASEWLLAVELADGRGQRLRLPRSALDYAYRTSRLKRRELATGIVLQAEFALQRMDTKELAERVARHQELRTLTQPRQLSAGSVFANPEGDFSGRLIEQAGLKGRREGAAQISAQHANFIVNVGGGRARDVYTLMRAAQQAVWAQSQVWLRPEIELVGRWSDQERRALVGPESQIPSRG